MTMVLWLRLLNVIVPPMRASCSISRPGWCVSFLFFCLWIILRWICWCLGPARFCFQSFFSSLPLWSVMCPNISPKCLIAAAEVIKSNNRGCSWFREVNAGLNFYFFTLFAWAEARLRYKPQCYCVVSFWDGSCKIQIFMFGSLPVSFHNVALFCRSFYDLRCDLSSTPTVMVYLYSHQLTPSLFYCHVVFFSFSGDFEVCAVMEWWSSGPKAAKQCVLHSVFCQ